MSQPGMRSLRGMAGAEWLDWPQTRAVFAALGAGAEVRAVGGAVRNTLLGRPVTEVDLATPAAPDSVMRLATSAGLKTVATGLDHGTVTVIVDGVPFEVTTLRKDVETYGRHAKVAFTDDWEADARRRDFTINALYADGEGTLHDPLGGLADIASRRIRFIGDARARIREDFLRILRFFRLNAEYGAPPYEAEGLAACVAERKGLERLSPERVHKEVDRMLVADGALAALEAMFDYGLLTDVLASVPYLSRLRRLNVLERALGREPNAILRLAALAVAVPEDADRLRERLRLSNAEHARLAAAGALTPHRAPASEDAARAALYRSGAETYRDRVLLAWADTGAGSDDPKWRGLYALPEDWRTPVFPLRGQDLIERGWPKGPAIGELLKRIEADWVAGGFKGDRAALLAAAERTRTRA